MPRRELTLTWATKTGRIALTPSLATLMREEPIRLFLVTDVDLADEPEVIATLKLSGKFDGDPLWTATGFTRLGYCKWSVEALVSSPAIDTALRANADPDDDVAAKDCVLQLRLMDGDDTLAKSDRLPIALNNDYSRAEDTTPLVQPTPGDWLDARTVRIDKTLALSDPQKVNFFGNTAAATQADLAAEVTRATTAEAAKVASTRAINAAGIAFGGGSLSADRTITVPVASQAEAEEGVNTSKAMTPERTAQAIAALASTGPAAGRIETYQPILSMDIGAQLTLASDRGDLTAPCELTLEDATFRFSNDANSANNYKVPWTGAGSTGPTARVNLEASVWTSGANIALRLAAKLPGYGTVTRTMAFRNGDYGRDAYFWPRYTLPEVVEISTVDDVAGSLAGKLFSLAYYESGAKLAAVYMVVDSVGAAPTGYDTIIEVAFAQGANPATHIQAALAAAGLWDSVTVDGDVVTVQDFATLPAERTGTEDVDTGFTLAQAQAGADSVSESGFAGSPPIGQVLNLDATAEQLGATLAGLDIIESYSVISVSAIDGIVVELTGTALGPDTSINRDGGASYFTVNTQTAGTATNDANADLVAAMAAAITAVAPGGFTASATGLTLNFTGGVLTSLAAQWSVSSAFVPGNLDYAFGAGRIVALDIKTAGAETLTLNIGGSDYEFVIPSAGVWSFAQVAAIIGAPLANLRTAADNTITISATEVTEDVEVSACIRKS